MPVNNRSSHFYESTCLHYLVYVTVTVIILSIALERIFTGPLRDSHSTIALELRLQGTFMGLLLHNIQKLFSSAKGLIVIETGISVLMLPFTNIHWTTVVSKIGFLRCYINNEEKCFENSELIITNQFFMAVWAERSMPLRYSLDVEYVTRHYETIHGFKHQDKFSNFLTDRFLQYE